MTFETFAELTRGSGRFSFDKIKNALPSLAERIDFYTANEAAMSREDMIVAIGKRMLDDKAHEGRGTGNRTYREQCKAEYEERTGGIIGRIRRMNSHLFS